MGQQPVTFGRRGVRRAPAPGGLSATRIGAGVLAPTAYDQGDPAAPIDSVDLEHSATEEQMARFIGPNWEKYRDLWLEMKFDGAPRSSFSIDAFAYSTFWLLYRRLYATAVTAALLQFGAFCFLPDYLYVFEIGLSLYLGFWGKALVVRRAMRTIDAIERSSVSSKEAGLRVDLRIERAGGVELISPAVATVTLAVFISVVILRPAAVRMTETIASPMREIDKAL